MKKQSILKSSDYHWIFTAMEKNMLNNRKKTEQHFPKECGLTERALFFLTFSTHFVEGEGFELKDAQCLHVLLCRNLSFLKSAYFQTLYGWYIPAKTALRAAYENWLVMEYLIMKPERAESLINISKLSYKQKKSVRNELCEFMPGRLVDALFKGKADKKGYGMFYGALCDYSHVTLKSVANEEQFNQDISIDNLWVTLYLCTGTLKSFYKHPFFARSLQNDPRSHLCLEEFKKELDAHLELIRTSS